MAPGAPLARCARGAAAAVWLASCLAACEGEVVNLGRSQGLSGGEAGAGASSSAGSAGTTTGGAKTWQLQEQPIVEQTFEDGRSNPTLTTDTRQLFFTDQPRFGDDLRSRIFRATKSGSSYVVENTALNLGELTEYDAASPAISGDAKELWLGLNVAEGLGGTDIWLSRSEGSSFGTPELVAELSSPADDAPRPPTLDGTMMALSSRRHGGPLYQVYLASRATTDAPWSEPSQALLATINSPDFQSADGFLAASGRELYFASTRGGGQSDLYVARRASLTEPFGEPALVPDLNLPDSEERMPWLSEDGRQLFFASNRSGGYALYRADLL